MLLKVSSVMYTVFQPNPNAESATVPVKQVGPVSVICVYNIMCIVCV